MSTERRGPGRPRQPYCPDCIKAGKPDVLKKPGYGYCPDCHLRRIRSYKVIPEPTGTPVDPTVHALRTENDSLREQLSRTKLELQAATDLLESGEDERIPKLERALKRASRESRELQLLAHEAGADVAHPDDENQLPPSMRVTEGS